MGKANGKPFIPSSLVTLRLLSGQTNKKREQLCWCLDDAASEYYTLMLENNKSATFTKIISNMNKRFCHQELPETSQVQFQTSAQGEMETLEECSERVLTLATRAYSRYSEQLMTEQAIMRFCQGCNDTIAGTEACIFKPRSMDAALDMIRWCQHTIKAVSAIQKTGKQSNESLSEKSVNSPVVLGEGSTKSSMDNHLSCIEEYIEKMMSTVNSLVQEQLAKQGTSPSSRSPNQDRSNNYSPRRNYGRGSRRRNNSGDRRYTRPGYYNNECFNCHKQDHYVKDMSEGVVSGVSTIRSLGAAKLCRVEVDIAGRKVLALVDSGSEVTILKDTIFDTLEPNPYVIREATMYGAGTNMTMPCRLTSPIKFKIGDMQFNQRLQLHVI
ncbi:Hypothetical predicted protein [Mytilus galloprovincialis]|uniref:Peptidase A2 domain-containing protein n=1 Tax=Mytilus galloprovincialis TaxID=29158 RepID=A0A8B6BMI3_MYTGA|nr:Hypothetical predicted protein [Mytilus galloprovincialis]